MTEFPSWDLRSIPIPEDIEYALVTPHSHEHPERNKPLWLIWKTRPLGRNNGGDAHDFPRLDSVCDTDESARAHYRMAVYGETQAKVYVERIPANHRFASSLNDWQMEAHMAIWKERLKRVDGD